MENNNNNQLSNIVTVDKPNFTNNTSLLNGVLSNFKTVTDITKPVINNNLYEDTSQQGIVWDKAFDKLPQFTNIHSRNVSDIMERIANEQSTMSLIGNSVGQTIFGELVGGTISGFGALPKIGDRLWGSIDAYERNALEEVGDNIKNWSDETFKIYQTSYAQKGFALNDGTWWATLMPSVASALSILLPAGLAAKGISLLGKGINTTRILGATSLLKDLSKTGKTLNDLSKAERLLIKARYSDDIFAAANTMRTSGTTAYQAAKGLSISAAQRGTIGNWMINTFAPAFISRQIDSSRESLNRYSSTYESVMKSLENDKMSKEDKESYAKKVASEAAHKGYLYSQGNLAFDIFTWTQLGKLRGKISSTVAKDIDRLLLKDAAMAPLLGEISSREIKNQSYSAVKKFLTEIGTTGLSEGLDEVTMDIAMNEGVRSAKLNNGFYSKDENNSFIERLGTHFTTRKNWDSFVGGFIGGMLMGTSVNTYGRIKNKYFSEDYKNTINNMATSFSQNVENFNKNYKLLQEHLDKNEPLEASMLYNKLISDILEKSAIDNTQSHFIEMLERMSKLDKTKLVELGYVNENNTYDENSKANLGKLIEDLKNNSKTYYVQNAQYNFDNPIINRSYNLQIARLKVQRDLVKENFDATSIKDVNYETIEKESQIELDKLHNEGLLVHDLYSNLLNLKKQTTFLESTSESYKGYIFRNNEQISILNKQLEYNTLDNTQKTAIKRDIKNLEYEIESFEKEKETVLNHLTTINSQIDSLKTDNELSFDKVQNIVTNELKSKDFVSYREDGKTMTSLNKNLESQLTLIDKLLSHYNTDEYKNRYKEEITEKINESNITIETDFKKSIENITTKDEAKEAIKKFAKDHVNISQELLNKLSDIAYKKVSDYELEKTNAENRTKINIENGTITTDEVIKNAPISEAPPLLGIKEYRTYQGVVYSIGDTIVAVNNGNRGNIPFIIESFNNDIVVTDGGEFKIEEIELLNKKQSSSNFSKLADSILEYSNSIKLSDELNDDEKRVLGIIDNDELIALVHRASQLGVTNIANKNTSNRRSLSSDTGTALDKLTREIFNSLENDIDPYTIPKLEYISVIAQKEWIDYILKLNETFKSKGLKVFANNIRVFDKDSQIGGTIDLLLIDENNRIYVYDLKTTNASGTLNRFGKDAKQLDLYLNQITVYAAILYKEFSKYYPNMSIAGVGFINVFKEYENKEIKSTFTNEDKSNLQTIAKAYLNENSTDSIDFDNGIITLPYNPSKLNTVLLEYNIDNKKVLKSVSDAMKLNRKVIETNNLSELIDLYEAINNSKYALFKETEDFILLLTSYFEKGKNGKYFRNNEAIAKTSRRLIEKYNLQVGDSFNPLDILATIYSMIDESQKTLYINDNHNLGSALDSVLSSLMHLSNTEELIDTLIIQNTDVNTLNSESIDANVINQIELKKQIMSIVQNILKNSENENINNSYYMQLLSSLISYKRAVTGDIDSSLDLDTIIELVYLSHFSENSDFENDIMPILKELPMIIGFMQARLKLKLNELWDENLNNSNITNLKVDSDNQKLYTNNDNPTEVKWENEELQDKYNSYKTIYDGLGKSNSIKVYSNNVIVNIKTLTDAYIRNVVKTIEETETSKFKGLLANAIVEETFNKDDELNENSIYYNIDKIKTDSNVQLTIESSTGNILINFPNSVYNFVISNTSRNVNNIKIIDDNNEFQGLSETFINSIIKTLSKSELLANLKEYNKYRLQIKANNITKSEKEIATNKRNILASDLSKGLSSNLLNSIKELLDIIYINNLDKNDRELLSKNNNDIDSSIYNLENVDNLLELIFYNRFLTGYNSYNPTTMDIKIRLNKFNLMAKESHRKYTSIIEATDIKEAITIDGKISKIYNPSVAIDNGNIKKLVDVIKHTTIKVDGGTKKGVHLITNLKGNAVYSGKGNLDNNQDIDLSGKDNKLYVLLEGLNGRLIPYPTRANTIKDSYNVNEENYSKKVEEHIISTLNSIFLEATKYQQELNKLTLESQVGQDVRNVRETTTQKVRNFISKKIEESGIDNLIIYNNDISTGAYGDVTNKYGETNNVELKHKYFNIYVSTIRENTSKESFETIFEFTTFENSGNSTIKTYHKYVAKENTDNSIKLVYYKVKDDGKGKLFDKLNNLKNNNADAKFVELKDLEAHLKTVELSGLLRQSHIDKQGKLVFQHRNDLGDIITNQEFVDPITGITYNDANNYVLDTGAVYARVKAISDGTTILSNLDLFGTASVKVDISVQDVITFGKGLHTDATTIVRKLTKKFNPTYSVIFDAIDLINKEIETKDSNLYGDITQMYRYLENTADNKNAQASTSLHPNKKILLNTFSDNLLSNLKNKDYNNAAITMLHEHIHKVILLSVYNSNLSRKEKLKIAKLNNDNILNFISEFRKQFSIFMTKNDNIQSLSKILGITAENDIDYRNKLQIVVSNYLSVIENNVLNVANKELELAVNDKNKEITGIEFGQELYTYYTNPYFMAILSSVTTDGSFYTKDTNNKKENFIDLLIKKLLEIYKKLLKVLIGIDFELDKNFSKTAKDMLSDLYNQLSNGITEIQTNNEVIEENIVSDELTEEQEFEQYTKNMNRRKLNSVFIPTYKEYTDDANNPLC